MKRKVSEKGISTSENGTAIVEFAVVSPLFFLLLLGMMQFGMLIQAKLHLTSACAQTTRWASFEVRSVEEIQSKIDELVSPMLPIPGYESTVVALSPVYDSSGRTVTVSAYYDYPIFVPIMSAFFQDGSAHIQASNTMRWE